MVAEGVETQEQLEFLLERSCNFAQGYFFSRPVPVDGFHERVNEINDRLRIETGWTARLRAIRA